MWKDFSSGYLKNNRTSGVSVMIAAFISALLLSLLCSVFYNLWVYEIERIKAEEGGWQGRIAGEISEEDISRIRNYANVERAVVNEELSGGQECVIDLYFINKRTVFTDLPRIAELISGKSPLADMNQSHGTDISEAIQEAEKKVTVTYHYALLNLYLIRSAEDTALRWVFPFTAAVAAAACLSLVLVIHNAFAVSMTARIHQFGILSSIGATPGQIRTCLLQEAFVLCAAPVLAGVLLGIIISMGMVEAVNLLLADVEGRLALPFCYHPLILCLSLLTAAVTLLVSAWIPARRMSRLTPLEAVKNTEELHLKRKKNSRILSVLFGIEGELAGNALKAQRKAMRTANLSLVLSFLAFSFMMCFITITAVSQKETYFARYQDAWDVMATVKDTDISTFAAPEILQKLYGIQRPSEEQDLCMEEKSYGVRSCVAYQKAAAKRIVTPEEISEEMLAAGGFEDPPAEYVSKAPDGWLVNAPLVILDDAGFLEYCGQIGAEPRLDGAVIMNITKDANDPNFRKRRILPYLTGNNATTVLLQNEAETDNAAVSTADVCEEGEESAMKAVNLPVLAYTRTPPVLREEYGTLDFHELVHFIPVSVWNKIKNRIGGAQQDMYLRILAREGTTPAELSEMEAEILRFLEGTSVSVKAAGAGKGTEQPESAGAAAGRIKIENRLRAQQDNDRMFAGMKAVLSVFCLLLASIGIGSVFSNTLGFVRQRRREFARYLSIGLTPEGMKKIFCVEAMVIAGRPALVALPVTAAAVVLFIRASYLEPMLFIREAPIVPILLFILAIFGFVALAYWLGAKRVLGNSLTDALRDDTVL